MKNIKDIKPTAKEREKQKVVVGEIISEIRKQGRDAVLVGSIAKNTCLRGSTDMDIFILFPKTVPRKQLEKDGLGIAKKVCKKFKSKPEKHYAQHPYIVTKIKGFDIDLVPCYKIKSGEKILSAVDRSPLHKDYIIKHLKNPDEVRKLKHFMQEIGVYSAEIAVHGFSGYLCELLVLKYGSFKKVLEAASDWKRFERIEVREHSPAVFTDPLMVIDPVDPYRNVAAAVSQDKKCEFMLVAREFLKKKKVQKAVVNPTGKVFVVKWAVKDDIADILCGQLQKFEAKVVRALKLNEFSVVGSFCWADSKKEAQILVEVEVWDLPSSNDWHGPSVYDKKNCANFIKKYKKGYVKDDKLVTQGKRPHTTALSLLKKVLKDCPSHLKSRPVVLQDAKAKKSRVYKLYTKRMWKLS